MNISSKHRFSFLRRSMWCVLKVLIKLVLLSWKMLSIPIMLNVLTFLIVQEIFSLKLWNLFFFLFFIVTYYHSWDHALRAIKKYLNSIKHNECKKRLTLKVNMLAILLVGTTNPMELIFFIYNSLHPCHIKCPNKYYNCSL